MYIRKGYYIDVVCYSCSVAVNISCNVSTSVCINRSVFTLDSPCQYRPDQADVTSVCCRASFFGKLHKSSVTVLLCTETNYNIHLS